MSKTTALTPIHQASKAKFINFSGYNMPVWYSSIKQEHLAVRQQAGMFDVSHMGLFSLSGPGADAFIERLSCNHIKNAQKQKMIYSMFLNESGMILDDVMFGKYNDKWHLVVNCSNCEKISQWMTQHKPDNVSITQHNDSHSLIAVQGPTATRLLSNVFHTNLEQTPRFGMLSTSYKAENCLLTRTGYTGEDGFEIMIPNNRVTDFWSELILAGVTPCGLACRDSLRIEYGLPLYGQELSESIHPFMTRYSWVVKFNHDFIGNTALKTLNENTPLTSVGLQLDTPMIARPHCTIVEGGEITSGTLSPITNTSIALAFVPHNMSALGSEVTVAIRKKQIKATVVPIPFI